jgi:beta-glucanase (GH16 family)
MANVSKSSRRQYWRFPNTYAEGKLTVKQRGDFLRLIVFLLTPLVCGLLMISSYQLRNSVLKIQSSNSLHLSLPKESNSTSPTQSNPQFALKPEWSQNFAEQPYHYVDPLYWTVLEGPVQNSNKEAQYYTSNASNINVENGVLHLTATNESQPGGYRYSSARIDTEGKKSFLYGRIDATVKLPSGVGTWPAVWLLPANNIYSDKSPESDNLRYKNGGEIDLIEGVGFEPNIIYSVAHTLSDSFLRTDGTGSFSNIKVPLSNTEFQKYSLLWTPDIIQVSVNDEIFFTYSRQPNADYKTWPFDQPFYLIANLAMGGTWGGMDTEHYPGNGIDDSALPASLDIKSIYYYPYLAPHAN